MLRRTNYGLWVDDDGKPNKNELAIDYIVESARSVGIEVIEGKTALDIQFMAEVMKRLREEQEPCEDCISRQAVLSMQYRIDDSATLSTRDVVNVDDIEDLPPVTPKPKTDVLDKIRAEIEENAYPIVHGVNNHEKGMTLYGILQVIDKYKAESEDNE